MYVIILSHSIIYIYAHKTVPLSLSLSHYGHKNATVMFNDGGVALLVDDVRTPLAIRNSSPCILLCKYVLLGYSEEVS